MFPEKGESIPQTIECLQEIMARDAVTIEKQDKEIAALKRQVEQHQPRLQKLRDRITGLKAQLENK